MNSISVVESFKFGKKAFKNNWLILVYALIFPAVFSLVVDVFYHANPMTYTNLSLSYLGPIVVFYIVKYLLNIMFKIGKIRIYLDTLKFKQPRYSELFNPKKSYLNFLVVSVLLGICTLGGLIVLIVPGIYIILRYCFAPILVLDQNMSISESFAKSKEMTAGNKWKMLPYYIIYGFLALLYMLCTALVYSAFADPAISLGNLPVIVVVLAFTAVLLIISNLAILHLYRKLLVKLNSEENGGQMDFQDIQDIQEEQSVQLLDEENIVQNQQNQ
ncbi:MAG: hypothetical protein WCO09_01260 [bacterium]